MAFQKPQEQGDSPTKATDTFGCGLGWAGDKMVLCY